RRLRPAPGGGVGRAEPLLELRVPGTEARRRGQALDRLFGATEPLERTSELEMDREIVGRDHRRATEGLERIGVAAERDDRPTERDVGLRPAGSELERAPATCNR